MTRVEYPDPPKRVELWWVVPDGPVSAVECKGGAEVACVFGVLYGMRADRLATKRETGREDVTRIDMRMPQEAFVVQRPSMGTFMRVMAANHIHGLARRAGDPEDKTHRF